MAGSIPAQPMRTVFFGFNSHGASCSRTGKSRPTPGPQDFGLSSRLGVRSGQALPKPQGMFSAYAVAARRHGTMRFASAGTGSRRSASVSTVSPRK